jgi:hypothetical protein
MVGRASIAIVTTVIAVTRALEEAGKIIVPRGKK